MKCPSWETGHVQHWLPGSLARQAYATLVVAGAVHWTRLGLHVTSAGQACSCTAVSGCSHPALLAMAGASRATSVGAWAALPLLALTSMPLNYGMLGSAASTATLALGRPCQMLSRSCAWYWTSSQASRLKRKKGHTLMAVCVSPTSRLASLEPESLVDVCVICS